MSHAVVVTDFDSFLLRQRQRFTNRLNAWDNHHAQRLRDREYYSGCDERLRGHSNTGRKPDLAALEGDPDGNY